MNERKERPGMMLYFETIDSLEEYTDDEAGLFLRAACEYSRNGVFPDFKDRGLRALWKRTMHDLDRDAAAYQSRCQQNRYNAYVSAEKRKFRRDHPGLGEAKEGKDFLTFEDWAEQIDEANASERYQSQANVSETEPIRTTTSAPASIPASQQLHDENTNTNGKGDMGEPTPTELQAAWREAIAAKDMKKAQEIDNALSRKGYTIDYSNGDISKRR